MSAALPPSVTTSLRFFICIGSTEVSGSNSRDVDGIQLLDEGENGRKLAAQPLDLGLLDLDARQMRNAMDERRNRPS